ncbi:MAG: hypothetical protein ABWY94_11925 [Pseudoxanthomonas sp.]
MVFAGVVAILSVVVPKLADVVTWLPDYSWFLGCGLGFASYYVLAIRANVAGSADALDAAAEAK